MTAFAATRQKCLARAIFYTITNQIVGGASLENFRGCAVFRIINAIVPLHDADTARVS